MMNCLSWFFIKAIMDVMNNLAKKQISCKDNSLLDGLWLEYVLDFRNMGNTIQDLCNEELHGEGNYTSNDNVQGSSFDSNNEEGNEVDIGERDEEVRAQENYEQHEKGNEQAKGCRHDDAKYGDGLTERNSNVVRKQRFEWRGIKCDILGDNGVFIRKGWVVACDPHETILDNQLGEDHVGLYILYCLGIVSTMMTIWR